MRVATIALAAVCTISALTGCGGTGSSSSTSTPTASAPAGGGGGGSSAGSGGSSAGSGSAGSSSGSGTGGSGSAGSGSTGSGSGSASTTQFIYTANLGSFANQPSGSISGFSIDSTSGALTTISGAPFAADFNPNALTSDPKEKFLFVGESGEVPGTRGGNCLQGHGRLVVESILATTGALTKIGETTLNGACPNGLVVDPNDQNLYVGDASFPAGDSQIEAYVIDGAGNLTPIPGSPFPNAQSGSILAMRPDGKVLYAEGSNAITVFNRNTASGALAPQQEVNVNTGYKIAITKSASYLVTSLRDSSTNMAQNDTVTVYAIGDSGNLTPVSSTSSGIRNGDVDTDPLGNFVALNGFISPGTTTGFPGGIVMYQIGSNGILTKVSGSPYSAGNTPFSVRFDQTGNFLYSNAFNDGDISAFRVDRNTGALSAVAGSPVKTGDFPGSLVIVSPR